MRMMGGCASAWAAAVAAAAAAAAAMSARPTIFTFLMIVTFCNEFDDAND